MKFYIHTYGCQMNVRDSEAVESLMIAAGHEKAASEDDAEVVVINLALMVSRLQKVLSLPVTFLSYHPL